MRYRRRAVIREAYCRVVKRPISDEELGAYLPLPRGEMALHMACAAAPGRRGKPLSPQRLRRLLPALNRVAARLERAVQDA